MSDGELSWYAVGWLTANHTIILLYVLWPITQYFSDVSRHITSVYARCLMANYVGILSDVSRHINLVFCLMSDRELFQYSVRCRIVNYVGILFDSRYRCERPIYFTK